MPLSSSSHEAASDTTSSSDENDLNDSPQLIGSFIPPYLRQFVIPYYGDFCQTPIFHERLIAQLCSEGFLPIATRGVLLPKLHRQRSVIQLPENLHVSKSVRKKASKFTVSINQDFDGVVQGCHEQHGFHCWLYPPLVAAFQAIYKQPNGMKVRVYDNDQATDRNCVLRMYSIEVYSAETNQLVAGELGYTVGKIYTSLTGFSRQDSAGSVQLAVLGKLLCQSGFGLWDLGMDMEYKRRLGAHLMPRTEFRRQVVRTREKHSHLVLSKENRACARNIIDRPITTAGKDSSAQGVVVADSAVTPVQKGNDGSPRRCGDEKVAARRKKQRVSNGSNRPH